MKKVAILMLMIYMTSCSENDEFEQSFGTQLISIEYKDDNDSWIENYAYSANGELNMIEDFRSSGRRYEIDYQNDKLKEYSTYRIDDGKLTFRDSILYNSNGTIQTIYHFSINSGEDLPLSWIYEYEYDNESKLSEKSTYFVAIQEYVSIEKYYWKKDNIERVEYYNEDEELYYEFFYEYDDKINYKKDFATSVSDPINWSENNVTEMNWNDYLGNLDIICRPCKMDYTYNLDNHPVEIGYNWGKILTLKYK